MRLNAIYSMDIIINIKNKIIIHCIHSISLLTVESDILRWIFELVYLLIDLLTLFHL